MIDTCECPAEVLDALAENRRSIVRAEAREWQLIARACDGYRVSEGSANAAFERLVSGGADGTPELGEFLALEIGPLLGMSPDAAAYLVQRVQNVRYRHPELWAATLAGHVRTFQAARIADRCAEAGLTGEAARWVDRQMATVARHLPWRRALGKLEGLIVKADPALAAERAEAARASRGVWVSHEPDAHATVFARLDTEDAAALNATVDALAEALALSEDTGTDGLGQPALLGGLSLQGRRDGRRASALGILADPARALKLLGHDPTLVDAEHVAPADAGAPSVTIPRTTLVVHVAAESIADGGVARIDGIGPVDTTTMRRLLGHAQVTVRPVIDLNQAPAVDCYEIPGRLRQAVTARQPFDTFPFSGIRCGRCDLDHTSPFDHLAPPGARQTRADNLAPVSRKAHRAKTAGIWNLDQPEPGVMIWTSPAGYRYQVDEDGTHPLGRQPGCRAA